MSVESVGKRKGITKLLLRFNCSQWTMLIAGYEYCTMHTSNITNTQLSLTRKVLAFAFALLLRNDLR